MNLPPIYMLIEETGRELRGRCLLALFAARAGIPSVIAPQWQVWETLDKIPRGLFLFKGNSAVQARNMQNAKAAGHLVASLEEEAMGLSDADQINRCYDPSVAEYCDLLLFQGDFQSQCVSSFLGPLRGARITGNPRLDFLAPVFQAEITAEAAPIRQDFGEFLLINSNFSTINPREFDACGVFETCVNAGWYNPADPADVEIFFAEAERENEGLEKSLSVIHALIDLGFPRPIIVRPHPSENITTWERAFADCPTVHVIRRGDHLAWTAAASLLLHTSCTTGMEAFILGTPAMSITPSDENWRNIITSNLVNPTFTDHHSAVRAIIDHFAKTGDVNFNHQKYWRALEPHSMIDPDRLASELVIDALFDLLRAEGVPAGARSGFQGFRDAGHSDRSVDLAALNAEAIGRSMHKAGDRLGMPFCPRVEDIAPGVVLCHPTGGEPDHANPYWKHR